MISNCRKKLLFYPAVKTSTSCIGRIIFRRRNHFIARRADQPPDIATVAGLTAAIDETNATVLVITHDRRLASAIGSSVLSVGNGQVQRDPGGVSGWLAAARQQASSDSTSANAKKTISDKAVANDGAHAATQASRIDGATRYKLQKEQTKLEKTLVRLEQEQQHVTEQLTQAAHPDDVQTLSGTLHDNNERVDAIELRLLEIMELLES